MIVAESDYQETLSAHRTILAAGYKLEYCPEEDKYYCLQEGETLRHRKEATARLQVKPVIGGGPSPGVIV